MTDILQQCSHSYISESMCTNSQADKYSLMKYFIHRIAKIYNLTILKSSTSTLTERFPSDLKNGRAILSLEGKFVLGL